jgi:hypothetical protein
MTTAFHIKAKITPWDDPDFVRAFENARDEVHTIEKGLDEPRLGELVQHRLREAGYPNATVAVERTLVEALEHTSHWHVSRDG